MKCSRCGRALGGEDRVIVDGGQVVCASCGRKKEPLVFTNGRRALKAARKRAVVTGYPVSITLVPDEERKRVRYFVKVRRRESGVAILEEAESP